MASDQACLPGQRTGRRKAPAAVAAALDDINLAFSLQSKSPRQSSALARAC